MDVYGNNVNLTNTTDVPGIADVEFSYSFQFWFFLPFHILSIPCYLFILTYILLKKTERQALHNHGVIVFLIVTFCIVVFDYSWILDNARHEGQVWLSSGIFCEFWWLIDFGFYAASTVFLAWASFERHILIFHSDLVQTKNRRILIHYLPLIVISLYSLIFSVCCIFFPPCENQYDFNSPECGAYPCYFAIPYLEGWDLFCNNILPTFLIAVFNVTLLIRVVWQKRHRRQNWKKCRRMTVQILSISSLFLSINLPLMVISFAQIIGYVDWDSQAEGYLFYFSGLIAYLLPFIYLLSLPRIWRELKLFLTRNTRQVRPTQN